MASHYGPMTNVNDIEVNRRFYVVNGNWYGMVVLIDNIKYIRILDQDPIIDHLLKWDNNNELVIEYSDEEIEIEKDPCDIDTYGIY